MLKDEGWRVMVSRMVQRVERRKESGRIGNEGS